ncbi:spermidine/putrescine ABC transporter permease PotC, partial [Candidatus Acetothermia bacterium]|nr:spermidine/putrescine ABC transporter permease PotC [Candidatus Acetothermia bacterium]
MNVRTLWHQAARRFDHLIDLLVKLDALLVYLFLYLPIFVLVLYSFNAGRYAFVWGGFSLETYQKVLHDPEVAQALGNSLAVAFSATLIATVLGTLLALALERYRFRGQRVAEGLSYLPILIPEIVMAVGLLLFFAQFFRPSLSLLGLDLGPLPTVIAGHVAFG